MASHSLTDVLACIHEAEALKKLLRHSWLSDGRQESVAEHTWRMAYMAVLLAPHLEQPVDLGKVLRMIIVHDVAEIRAGDYHAFKDVPADKRAQEARALAGIVSGLGAETAGEIQSLWNEFEDGQTPEARFAQALDKLEVLIQHNEADITTWDAREYDFNLTYAYNKVAYSPMLKQLRDLILSETKTKIAAVKRP